MNGDGINRDDRAPGAFAGALLPPFLAVIAVTAILTALFVWFGPDDPDDTGVLSAGQETTSASASATATPPASSPPASSPPASSPPASTTPAPSTSAPSPSQKPGPDRPEVVVLNQSGEDGMARRVADRVRQAGWTVFKTGSFRGTVSTTTVYFPDGLRDQAEVLARDLPGDPRVKERFSNLSETRLTIVLTDDYGE
jgi:hypothetical protein